MPRLPDDDDDNHHDDSTPSRPALAHGRSHGRFDSESLLSARRAATRFWNGFADFALQDNVLEVAMGLILAAAFTTIVTSFTSDMFLPVVSLLPFLNRNLEEKFAVLRYGQGDADGDDGFLYNTVKQALDDGAVVLAYGSFLDKCVRFLAVTGALYLIARLYALFSHDSVIKNTVKCRYCRKRISDKALRCFNCTSWQDGRES